MTKFKIHTDTLGGKSIVKKGWNDLWFRHDLDGNLIAGPFTSRKQAVLSATN